VGNQPMSWAAIKLHIGAVGNLKKSDNRSIGAFGEIAVFVNRSNAIAHLKVLRLRHSTLLTRSALRNAVKRQQ
jgi:hypothetical protein